MAGIQSYDYSLTEHHIEPFQYADPNTSFLEETPTTMVTCGSSSSIEDHREHFIVIVLRAVDDNGNATSHNHSIIIDVRHQHGKFDVVTLMAAL